jgi:hypothetical protein
MVLCFVLLPLVPLAAILALPDRVPSVWLDPIAVFVYAAVGVALISGAISFAARRTAWRAVAYAVTTGALSVVPVGVLIAIAFEINCGGDRLYEDC